ncbi:glycosyltransferase family 2 protein [Conexibacter sp. S30A1]|uniref:glycosyltransferase family 2 protein n=1 Tax=Conexibacter sp. S30A1 TaxID=2937800 RepID=UPI00200D558B|nr:glycosyltransferase family 2 protein [Conexibacter sp. S30A1]
MSSTTPSDIQPTTLDRSVPTGPTVSVVIPCLNEEEAISACVASAVEALARTRLSGEVIVVDNASEDRSAELAAAAGARVVFEPRRGYGSAYLAGFLAATGDYVVMADADLTYDFAEIPRFVERIEKGADVVMGDRMDNIEPGAMPWLHRYVGNPLLSGLLNVLFRTGVRDAHCGMRAFRRSVLPQLDLRTTGMEFASEMVIRAAKANLRIEQIPITYHPREGESKLSSFRDGWRHLRFLLLHRPTYLFVLPGLVLLILGLIASAVTIGQIAIFGRGWQIHTLIAGSLLEIIGVQVIGLGLCALAYATYFMSDDERWFNLMRARFRLEHGLALGVLIGLSGVGLGADVVVSWINSGFGPLAQEEQALLSATLLIIGVQVFFTSFLLSILGLRREERR